MGALVFLGGNKKMSLKNIAASMCLFFFLTACGAGESETSSTPEGQTAGDCTDEADNDGDGDFDCNDSGCAGAPACQEEASDSSDASDASDATDATDSSDATDPEPVCGNGTVEEGETCDDGAANSDLWSQAPHCNSSCSGNAPHCGDGAKNGSEDCDTGGVDTLACNATCTDSLCGDAYANAAAGEECDDGNASETDACLPGCIAATCGDEFTHEGVEACDDGNGDNSDSCVTDCTLAVCGDGYIYEGVETCDEGLNNTNAYGGPGRCNLSCIGSAPYCGDGIQDSIEECDDGNTSDGDYCSADCLEATTICGDGIDNEVCHNGDGTITDSARGITWMACAQGMTYNAAGNTCDGSYSNFQYCGANDNSCNGGVSGGLLDGGGNSEAWDTCDTLEFAGYTDWRVPNIEELASLLKCNDGPLGYPGRTECGSGNYTQPAIDTALFPNFPTTTLWTSASYVVNSLNAWLVDFNYGFFYNFSKDNSLSVLCVR